MIAPPRTFGWRSAVLCGLLWGVGVTLADTLTQPVDDVGLSAWTWFALGLLWQWTLCGLVWSLGSNLLARGRWALARMTVLLPVAVGVAIATQWVSPVPQAGAGGVDNVLVGRIPMTDLTAYVLWMNLFYGGLYVTGYLATLRAARARRRLAAFRLARSEADLMLREARVDAFRGQIQPAMLLAALAALREHYARDPEVGDALFDRLIAFLRAAMPSVRSGFSVLQTEIETVRNYSLLRESLALPGAAWRIETGPDLPAIPFPALVLLPALDDLGAQLPPGGHLSVRFATVAGGVLLTIDADRPARLSTAIEKRLRGGLSLTFGSAAQMLTGPDLPLTIRLRTQRLDDGSDAYPVPPDTGDSDAPRPPDRDSRRDPVVLPRSD